MTFYKEQRAIPLEVGFDRYIYIYVYVFVCVCMYVSIYYVRMRL